MMHKQKSLSIEKDKQDDQCYVRNSSFLSRDIEAQKTSAISKVEKESPPKTESPKKVISPPKREASVPKKEPTPPVRVTSKKEVMAPPVAPLKLSRTDSKEDNPVVLKASKVETASPPKKEISPPPAAFKIQRTDSKAEDSSVAVKVAKRENSVGKEIPVKTDKLSLVTENTAAVDDKDDAGNSSHKVEEIVTSAKGDQSAGVGDKIKKFEKAAEDASAGAGRHSRAGSVRGRARTERLASDSKEDFPPPATPFKDNVHFDLCPDKPGNSNHPVERQQNPTKNHYPNVAVAKWQRSESEDKGIQKHEPQKIIKPEFKPMSSPLDVTIRSPSLGAKIADQFPSQGTAFRNVASPDQTRTNIHKFNEDVNTQNNFKTCKFKPKEKYSVSKGSSYFTRGSEEIWLVKKKDIEEIEERVLDSFRRAGGNVCARSESMRPSSDSGQSAGFTHATMGRNKRQMYARSESLDPQWAGARAQTLKRQTSVACTCGHDKKTRARSAGAAAAAEPAPRPRSRSHGDDNNQAHVLDKYETLV